MIDFEGTRQSGIVEYGVVTLLAGQIVATYSRLCAPVGTITDSDRLQHGISEAAAMEHPPFDAEWEFFAGLRETGPLCAHNCAVEDGLLKTVWVCPRNSPDFSKEASLPSQSWGPWLDTLHLYRRIYPGLSSYKLGALIEMFGLKEVLKAVAQTSCPPKRGQYHCALYDALASALLLQRLWEEPEFDELTLPWLIVNSAPSMRIRDDFSQQELF